MLDIINLNFDYSDKPLLTNVSFQIEHGRLLHIRGDNGTGKTTLLKLIAGLLQPADGDIQYQGHSISEDRSAYQQHICYVGHKPGVSQLLTVREQCYFELHSSKNTAELDELLERFSLLTVADVQCNLLSAGLLRRVGLLRVLINKKSIWLLDEPLNALDQTSGDFLKTCVTEHLQQGGIILLTSHQPLLLNSAHCQEYFL